MSGDDNHRNNRPSREIQDFRTLVKFCLRGVGVEDNTEDGASAMDPERVAFLENALKSISVDIVQELRIILEIINKNLILLKTETQENRPAKEVVGALTQLQDMVEDVNIANDFGKIGGVIIIPTLLQNSHPEIVIQTCRVVSALTQNNEYCQKLAVEGGVLPCLLTLLDCGELEIESAAVSATSSILRGNVDAQKEFVEKLNGLNNLLTCLTSGSDSPIKTNIRVKTAFLLEQMIRESSFIIPEIIRLGFFDSIVVLLHKEFNASHEMLLGCLLNILIHDETGEVKELCRRDDLSLTSILVEKTKKVDPEWKEEVEKCVDILNLLEINRDCCQVDK